MDTLAPDSAAEGKGLSGSMTHQIPHFFFFIRTENATKYSDAKMDKLAPDNAAERNGGK